MTAEPHEAENSDGIYRAPETLANYRDTQFPEETP